MNYINEMPALSGNTKSLMVLLHGLGSNGDDLFSLVPFFTTSLPDTHFFSPNGIEPCDMAPFGYQWFSLQDRNEEATRLEIERNISVIDAMIDKKKTELGLKDEDVILCGFSQGAMVSLYLGLSMQKSYNAIIAFSGALITPQKPYTTTTPICLIHGMQDDVVPYSNMSKASDALQAFGINVEMLGIPHLAHSIDMQGLNKATEFIKSRL